MAAVMSVCMVPKLEPLWVEIDRDEVVGAQGDGPQHGLRAAAQGLKHASTTR